MAATHMPTQTATAPAPRGAVRIIGLDRALRPDAFSDPSAVVRQAALGTVLARPETATPLRVPIAARLADPHESEVARVLAAKALGHVRPLPISDLVAGLTRMQGPLVRVAAATALIAGPGEAAAASEPLARCLLAGDAAVRMQSVLALRGIGAEAVPYVVRVVEEFEKFDITRMSGLDALGFIGADAGGSLALAERLSADAPPGVMVCARFAAASIKGAAIEPDARTSEKDRAKAIAPLLEMIRHEDQPVRLLAVERLGWLRDGAASAGTALTDLLKQGAPAEREAAALSLARSRTPTETALDPLVAALGDPEPGVRKAACIALSAYGSDAKPGLEPMLALVKDTAQPQDVRRAAGEGAKAIMKATKGPYWT